MWTDDPIKDFERYDAEQERLLEKLPRCSECYEAIQGEYCYEVNGEHICEECMKDNHRILVENICDEW